MRSRIRQRIEAACSKSPVEVYSARGYHNRKIKPAPPQKILEESDLLSLDRVLNLCDQRDGLISTRIARMLINTIRRLRPSIQPEATPADGREGRKP